MGARSQLNVGTLIGPRYGGLGAGHGYQTWQTSAVKRPGLLLDRITVLWIADTNGYAEVCLCGCRGWLERVVTVPDPNNAPTDNYDVTLENEYGRDYLDALCLNRDTSQPETAYIYKTLADANWQRLPKYGEATLKIQNAGARKAGRVILFLVPDLAMETLAQLRPYQP